MSFAAKIKNPELIPLPLILDEMGHLQAYVQKDGLSHLQKLMGSSIGKKVDLYPTDARKPSPSGLG